MDFLVTYFFPFLNDVIRNLLHGTLGLYKNNILMNLVGLVTSPLMSPDRQDPIFLYKSKRLSYILLFINN